MFDLTVAGLCAMGVAVVLRFARLRADVEALIAISYTFSAAIGWCLLVASPGSVAPSRNAIAAGGGGLVVARRVPFLLVVRLDFGIGRTGAWARLSVAVPVVLGIVVYGEAVDLRLVAGLSALVVAFVEAETEGGNDDDQEAFFVVLFSCAAVLSWTQSLHQHRPKANRHIHNGYRGGPHSCQETMMAVEFNRRGPVTATAQRPPKKRRSIVSDLYATGVGKKYVMAITGILGIGFVIAHMVGNLKMYLGPVTEGDERVYDIDVYGEFLRNLFVPIFPTGVSLWVLRLMLIGAVGLHIHAAWGLTVMNRRSRAVKYQGPRDYQIANFASRSMRWTGIIVGLFIVWHLADMTWGLVTPGHVPGAAYYNIDRSLSRLPVAALYIVANLALGVHLFHGTWSLFQSMGWNNPRFNTWRRNIAIVVAAAIVAGNVSFPIAVLAGIVEYDPSAVTEPIEDSTI